jgi:hypothetical protein
MGRLLDLRIRRTGLDLPVARVFLDTLVIRRTRANPISDRAPLRKAVERNRYLNLETSAKTRPCFDRSKRSF